MNRNNYALFWVFPFYPLLALFFVVVVPEKKRRDEKAKQRLIEAQSTVTPRKSQFLSKTIVKAATEDSGEWQTTLNRTGESWAEFKDSKGEVRFRLEYQKVINRRTRETNTTYLHDRPVEIHQKLIDVRTGESWAFVWP